MTYKRNFITDVICRVDFPEIPKLKKEEPIEFYEKIRTLFKRYEKSVSAQLRVEEFKGISIQEQAHKWKFFNKEKDKKITLSHNCLSFEFFKYSEFNEFKEIWEMVYNSLLDVYKIEFFDRLGLRYINNIDIKKGKPLSWDGLINKYLTSHLKSFPDLKPDVIRSMHKIIFNKDGIKINLSYGIWNDDFPSSLSKKQFILDYDCYIDFMIEPSEVNTKISEFIKIIYDLFEICIDYKLREIMGEEN